MSLALLLFSLLIAELRAQEAAPALQPIAAPSSAPSGLPTLRDSFPELHDLLKARDPFKSPVALIQVVVAKSPLESFPVDAFKMVGVLTGPERNRAMVLDPSGRTHIVKENMRMGLRDGVVLKVFQNKIVVREKIANIFGEIENQDEEIALQKPPKR